jgi:hypothetical protein
LKHHFQPPAGEEELIETEPFLLAAGEVLVIIDFLGPTFLKSAFQRTRADIAGNVTTLQNKYNSDPIKYKTLNQMLTDERESGNDQSATVALLWLKRGLEFICCFSKFLVADQTKNTRHTGSLCNITLQAYEHSLKRFHNWFVRGLFYLVAHILPSRKDFLKVLAGGQDNMEEQVIEELNRFVSALTPNLDVINRIYIEMGKNEDM